jgi:hypothetical protein
VPDRKVTMRMRCDVFDGVVVVIFIWLLVVTNECKLLASKPVVCMCLLFNLQHAYTIPSKQY